MFYAAPGEAPGVPCLSDSSDKSCGVYLRVAFMTAFIVNPGAIIRGRLLYRPRLLTGKIRYSMSIPTIKYYRT